MPPETSSAMAIETRTVPAPVRASIWRRWVYEPIRQQLTQGTSPHKIAQAIAFGVTIGIFPIIGSTTLISLMIGVPLKLNQPILQAFKTLATPLQWALILGFYRVGEWAFHIEPVSLSIPVMIEEFAAAPGPFFAKYGITALGGIGVWIIALPFMLAAIYFSTRPLIEAMARRIRRTANV